MADINVVDLTNANDTGVFDALMSAVETHLTKEFSQNRITGTEYSKVYLGVMDTTMSQSIQFLLQKDISAAQIKLLAAQTSLVETQQLNAEAEILLTQAQTAKVTKEIELLDDQKDLIQAQVVNLTAQTAKVNLEIEVLGVQKTKLTAEVALVNAQTAESNKRNEMITAQIPNVAKEGLVLDQQVEKLESEINFLNQRIVTEKAQVMDIVDGNSVTGVIGHQKDLYAAQTMGFTHNAEQKLLKMMLDTWTVRRSTDDATEASTINKLSDPNIGAAMIKCMGSVGITPV